MATGTRTYQIGQGAAAQGAQTVTLLGTGVGGVEGSSRRLVHPDAQIPPVVYFSNPDRTLNFHNDVLTRPITQAVMTLGTTQVVRFDRNIDDTIVTEVWEAAGRKVSTITTFWVQLYDLWLNPPAFDATNPVYIIWEPRDETADRYNVEILAVNAGGESDFDLGDVKPPAGIEIAHPLDFVDAVRSGLVDRTVTLAMKIVSKVT